MTWLNRVCELPIKRWTYEKRMDPLEAEHIGPLAEDWQRIMGVGDGITINFGDAIGIALKAIQELRAEVDTLKSKLNQ